MSTNKPEVVAYSWQCHGRHITVDKKFADWLVADGEVVDPLIRLSDYEALQAELARELQRRFDGNEQASREHRAEVAGLVKELKWLRGAINLDI